jgi:hypothetical protein
LSDLAHAALVKAHDKEELSEIAIFLNKVASADGVGGTRPKIHCPGLAT